jgi:hypothetical protein
MLRTSMEKMATYTRTKFGDEATQEWISGKRINPPEPAHLQAILNRCSKSEGHQGKDRDEAKGP